MLTCQWQVYGTTSRAIQDCDSDSSCIGLCIAAGCSCSSVCQGIRCISSPALPPYSPCVITHSHECACKAAAVLINQDLHPTG